MTSHETTSPTGWWMAGLLERRKADGGIIYSNNYRLILADHWRDAFRKAKAFGAANAQTDERTSGGGAEFVGVSDLTPIYESFVDGAEMLWQELEPLEDRDKSSPMDVYSEAEMAEIYEPDS